MKFLRKYLIVATAENHIVAYFNNKEDALEHIKKLDTLLRWKYSNLKLFAEV